MLESNLKKKKKRMTKELKSQLLVSISIVQHFNICENNGKMNVYMLICLIKCQKFMLTKELNLV